MFSQAVHNRLRLTQINTGVVVLLILVLPGIVLAVPDTGALSQSTWFVDMNRFAESAHAALKCEDCHGTMMVTGRRHPDPSRADFLKTDTTRSYDYGRCQQCHRLSHERYLMGAHAKSLAKANTTGAASKEDPQADTSETKLAPTCGDCHSSHYVRSALSRVSVGQQAVHTCGRCHPEHAASYLENIHGKLGANLENEASAFCTDCHGAHRNSSLDEPQDALAACRRCHPKAESAFTDVVIHAGLTGDVAAESSKAGTVTWIKGVRIAAIFVVGLSLFFFFAHSSLWLLREIHQKLRKP